MKTTKQEKFNNSINNAQNELQKALDILDNLYNNDNNLINKGYQTYATNKIVALINDLKYLKKSYNTEIEKEQNNTNNYKITDKKTFINTMSEYFDNHIDTTEKETYRIYQSEDFGKTWEFYSETTTHDILELMEEDCEILGDDYLYDDDLRIVYNSYGEVFAYLNDNENENDLKNKRVVR